MKFDKDVAATLAVFIGCGLLFHACTKEPDKRPYPPGTVRYQIGWECRSGYREVYSPVEIEGCEYVKEQEWLKNNPKEKWVWY